jgi:inward rectifier potassium channel
LWLVPGSVANARPDSFTDAFFFSIETLSTVGYGEMYPATLYGHVVASSEILCGLGFNAVLTGLTFVRFSRPKAKLVFAANPVVAMQNGKPTLMVRIGQRSRRRAYGRGGEAERPAHRDERGRHPFPPRAGAAARRAHLPLFPLHWTLMHVLDDRSPLHGYDAARAIEANAQLFVMLEARSDSCDGGARHP